MSTTPPLPSPSGTVTPPGPTAKPLPVARQPSQSQLNSRAAMPLARQPTARGPLPLIRQPTSSRLNGSANGTTTPDSSAGGLASPVSDAEGPISPSVVPASSPTATSSSSSSSSAPTLPPQPSTPKGSTTPKGSLISSTPPLPSAQPIQPLAPAPQSSYPNNPLAPVTPPLPRTPSNGAASAFATPPTASQGLSPAPPAVAQLPPGTRDVKAWAAREKGAPLECVTVTLPPLGEDCVEVRVICCGVCASDIDALGKYGAMYRFPLVAGHEGVGVVTECGKLVRHLRVGQRVGLGVYRGACGACMFCANGQNNLCSMKELMFMNGSHGAFAEYVRIKGDFAIPIPDAIQTEHAGPLMCAGVTVFAPFRRYNIQSGQRIGVLGIGGLGHLAIQIAAKWGCEVVALSTSANKALHAKELGANRFVNIMVEAEIKPIFGTLDYLLVTASGDSLDYRALLGLLAPNGKLVVIGVSFKEQVISPVQLLVGQKSICGSAAGSSGIALDMLRFCAVHNIKPLVETFPFKQSNEAIERVTQNQVRFRAVLMH